MKKSATLLILFSLVFLIAQGQTLSQEVFCSGTVWSMGLDGSFSGTIGQTFTGTFSNGSIVLTQGFHQPDGNASGIDDQMIAVDIRAYPNPVKEILCIDLSCDDLPENLSVRFTDLQGRLLFCREVTAKNSTYNLTAYSSGLYFLSFSTGKIIHSSIKISKY